MNSNFEHWVNEKIVLKVVERYDEDEMTDFATSDKQSWLPGVYTTQWSTVLREINPYGVRVAGGQYSGQHFLPWHSIAGIALETSE